MKGTPENFWGLVQRKQLMFGLIAVLAVLTLGATVASAQQASITLLNCNNALCNANNTAWTLAKEPNSQSLVGDGTISWTVTATKGATTDNFITVNGFITVKNTGSADATIGNIVVNLQKQRAGANTGACRNVPWVSAAADVATANSGDAATTANIVASASQEVAGCNAAQGPPNYTVSGAKGTFTETAGSSTLEFTDADSNSVFSLTPEKTIAPGASINLLYSAKFDNTVLGLAVGSSVRSEVIVTFGNSGPRGGSGSSAQDIDIDGDGVVNTTDEHLVRSVPCRVTSAIPALQNGNGTVTLSDTLADVSVVGTNVSLVPNSFSTDIGGGTGSENISATTARNVSVGETCTPQGAATVNNTAHLDGASSSVNVQIGQNCVTDPYTQITTCTPIFAEFVCVQGVALDDGGDADVSCQNTPPPPTSTCTYTQGGYGNGSGVPSNIFNNNFIPVFSSGLTIGINDGAGPKHDALWNATVTGRTALKSYLGGGGPSGALTADTVDASSTSGGTLAKQTAALTLNIGFDAAGVLPNGVEGFGSLQVCNTGTGADGKTVTQILADANKALGENVLPSYAASFGDLNTLVTNLNESFDNCTASAYALAHLCVAP